MKKILLSLLFLLVLVSAYALGFCHAVNESVYMLWTKQAQSSVITLRMINEEQLREAVVFNEHIVEDNLIAMQRVDRSRWRYLNFPSMYFSYMKTFGAGAKKTREIREQVLNDYRRTYRAVHSEGGTH